MRIHIRLNRYFAHVLKWDMDYKAHYTVNFSRSLSPDGPLIVGNVSETKVVRQCWWDLAASRPFLPSQASLKSEPLNAPLELWDVTVMVVVRGVPIVSILLTFPPLCLSVRLVGKKCTLVSKFCTKCWFC